MQRGGAVALAAQLLLSLSTPREAPAQSPVRTRDASVATIRYDNGVTAGALTLFEAISLQRELSTTSAYGLLSLFGDGRWSLQGELEGSRRSAAVPTSAAFTPFFRAMRGEMALNLEATAQAGFMPTFRATPHARVLFEHDDHGGRAGAAVARSFDGRLWQTAVIGEMGAWRRRGTTLLSLTATTMQLGVGDVLSDFLGVAEWSRGRSFYTASLGTRLGEAQRGIVNWGSFTLTWPLRDDIWTTFSIGNYPADLMQNLPGGRFVAFTMRLPNGRFPEIRRRPPPLPPPPPPPVLPITERLAMVVGHPLDSLDLREIRVWAPGVEVVELLADFVDWVPVPLIRQPNGEWQGYYRVPEGPHRVNLRLDGHDLDVPTNWPVEKDEILGAVGVVIVR